MKTLHIAFLNVAFSPQYAHDSDAYSRLFQRAYELRTPIKLHGDTTGLIGGFRVDGEWGFGRFYKFLDLRIDDSWFDIVRHQEAEDRQLEQIRIPPNLKPHLRVLDFVVSFSKHTLVFVTREDSESLSPRLAKKLLAGVFSHQVIASSFGVINITIEPRKDALARILAMPNLRELTIELTPPNPDDLVAAEQRLMRRMRAENARKLLVEITANHDGLRPDAEHTQLAEIAQKNGKVLGKGKNNDDRVVRLSTQDQPRVDTIVYDPDAQTSADALAQKAYQALIERQP
ncbi:MAG: DUF4747 family protein [Planctomycetes bacterium]|nr:DUF4747 family protein [Planctomycetota bacterium]